MDVASPHLSDYPLSHCDPYIWGLLQGAGTTYCEFGPENYA